MRKGITFFMCTASFILYRLNLQRGESKMSVEEAVFLCLYSFARFSLAIRSVT
jgi:hypothetical protein